MGKKSIKLQEIHRLFEDYGIECIDNIEISALSDLRSVFKNLEDKRFEPYVENLLSDIVMRACLISPYNQ